MKLQSKLLLSLGSALLAIFALVEIVGYQQTRENMLAELRKDALEIRGILMATRRIYHHQFIDSDLPLNKKTLGFLPAYALRRISDDFKKNWSNSGLSFNNVSDRPRNQKNMADKIELEAMDYFHNNPKAKERLVPFDNAQNQPYYHFSTPIWVEEYCLKCHGAQNAAPETIREEYDTAFNYRPGELRGLMSIKLPAKFVQNAVFDIRIREAWGRFAAFFIVFIFGSWLFRNLVIRRLKDIQSAAERITQGDTSARVQVQGEDELSQTATAFNEMTDRRQQAEASLIKSEAHLRAFIQTVPDLIWLKDPDGVYQGCNPKFERLFGAKESEILGKTDYDFVDNKLADFFRENDKIAMAAGEPCMNEEEVTYADDGHTEILETVKTPMFDHNGRVIGVLGIARDITDRKKAEAEQARMQRELQQSNKMEALGQVTGGIAHDFNNILGIIMGYSELAIRHSKNSGDAKQVKQLEFILNASERAKNLVASMLSYSRNKNSDDRPLHLQQLINENLSMLRSTLPTSIEITTEIEESLPPVLMDQTQVHQLLMNLCINARDAMKGCGNITIHLGMAKTLNAECSACHSELTGDWVELSVTDTGGGIGADKLKRIFDPFYTTKDVGKGTGMGLAVIHGIMRSHGGHILVETTVGAGSTFRLLFPPASQEVTAPQEPDPSSILVPPGQGEHILVLDDEPDLADYLGNLLEYNGYMITVMNNSREALERFRENPDEFGLLVTDQTMPEMTGIEVLTKMRELRPGLPVILNTGFSEDIDSDTAAAMGIHYLEKPVIAKKVLLAVAELLGRAKQDTQ
ncbi:MAG: DUF3365 domain-containing protein [Gammaproteobacteria bacterium]|nr:DUF3365 domain-containing protein [Gammaproteobacteria bacterium]